MLPGLTDYESDMGVLKTTGRIKSVQVLKE
jgi:hypothetical protein